MPKRSEILNFSSKKLTNKKNNIDKDVLESDKYFKISKILNGYKYCKLSNEKLQFPVVSDYLGFLYNKDKVIEHILKQKKGHSNDGDDNNTNIKSLNDVIQLKIDLNSDVLKCKISNISVNLNNDSTLKLSDVQFSYIVPCGCTMNSKILKALIDVASEGDLKCPLCSKSFTSSNIIEINSQDDKVKENLKNRIIQLKDDKFYHNLKPRKSKKRKLENNDASQLKKIKIK